MCQNTSIVLVIAHSPVFLMNSLAAFVLAEAGKDDHTDTQLSFICRHVPSYEHKSCRRMPGVRLLVSLQVLESAMQKGLSLQAGTQKAMDAGENAKSGASSISEDEKTFTSKVQTPEARVRRLSLALILQVLGWQL